MILLLYTSGADIERSLEIANDSLPVSEPWSSTIKASLLPSSERMLKKKTPVSELCGGLLGPSMAWTSIPPAGGGGGGGGQCS